MPDTSQSDTFLTLQVQEKSLLAEDIWLFDLVGDSGQDLPSFEPGAHVTLVTPSGARRQYSLCGPVDSQFHYRIAIKVEREGRGASLSMVDQCQPGMYLEVSPPANTFQLVDTDEYLLIAGGIGITPIFSMIQHLEQTGHGNYTLIYCSRSPEQTAFREQLETGALAGRITIHHDQGDPDRLYDFWPHFEKPGNLHVYCCGPRPLMDEIRDMSGHWPNTRIHFEDFASDIRPLRDDDSAFTVEHCDTHEVVEVPADRTILECLRDAGHALASSCESGTCGSCKVPLISGEADHRDMVLEEGEKSGNIMICVSRARSDRLVLRW